MMARPSRQLAQAQGAQFAAQRLLADRDAEFLEDPLRQVDPLALAFLTFARSAIEGGSPKAALVLWARMLLDDVESI
jgi:hypothetical protein